MARVNRWTDVADSDKANALVRVMVPRSSEGNLVDEYTVPLAELLNLPTAPVRLLDNGHFTDRSGTTGAAARNAWNTIGIGADDLADYSSFLVVVGISISGSAGSEQSLYKGSLFLPKQQWESLVAVPLSGSPLISPPANSHVAGYINIDLPISVSGASDDLKINSIVNANQEREFYVGRSTQNPADVVIAIKGRGTGRHPFTVSVWGYR